MTSSNLILTLMYKLKLRKCIFLLDSSYLKQRFKLKESDIIKAVYKYSNGRGEWMSATVLRFEGGKRGEIDSYVEAAILMQEYYAIFDLEDVSERQTAYALWHTKAMIVKNKTKK